LAGPPHLFAGKEKIMPTVNAGQFVQVHYTGSLEDGTVFDSSEGRVPLEFQAGRGMVIPGFDKAVLGMKLNEEKQITLTKDQAYGDPREDLKREFPTSMLGGEEVKAGRELWFNSPRGPVNGKVLAIDAEKFTVDFNHPLAGKSLHFSIRVVGISDTPTQASCTCSTDSGEKPSGCGPGCSC
jgi:peptidylprolyl isomerase